MALRFGLIGAGRWGKVYLRTIVSLGQRCRITHLSTSSPENARLVPYSVEILPDWRALIASDCDAVIIASPPHTHAEMLEACLGAGKPCIVEKPLCLDIATAERLHQSVQRTKIPVLVNHVHLFNPAYQALKQTVRAAGQPIRLILSEGMGLGPFRPDTTALWDWCPHDLGLCLDLLGRLPARVEAIGFPFSPAGASELISIRLDFSDGACAGIQAGRLWPQRRRNLSVFTDTHLYRLDDADPKGLTVLPFSFHRRYEERVPDLNDARPIFFENQRLPMDCSILYFLDGLAGADRSCLGTQLAVDVIRLLARCEETLRTWRKE